MVYRRDVRVA